MVGRTCYMIFSLLKPYPKRQHKFYRKTNLSVMIEINDILIENINI